MKLPYSANSFNIGVRPLEEKDIESLRIWRSDPSNSFFLKTIGDVTTQMQLNWYRNSLLEEDSYIFAVDNTEAVDNGETRTEFVGSLAIYDVNGDIAEIGKMLIDQKSRGKKIGFTAMNLALHIGFQKLEIHRFLLEVHEDNIAAKTNYLRNGFERRGEHIYPKGGIEWDMILDRKRFYMLHPDMKGVAILNAGL